MSIANLVPTQGQSAEIDQLRQRLQWAELRIQQLEERLRLERIAKYGPASEKLNDQQLELLELEPGVSSQEVVAEAGREPDLETVRRSKGAARPHPGRQELPADLPRVERVLEVKAEERSCKACGQATAVIGYDESEQLEVEPARYYVLVTKREKRVCACCTEGGVKTAALPKRILDKSLVSDRVILDTVVSKYSDHLPLYRQSAILERETGIEISRATMDGWLMRVGELLVPVVNQMRRNLVSGSYIQADETPVDVQVRDGSGSNHQAYLWQYGKPGGETVFDFRMGRGREGPKNFLGQYAGILQTDGYAAYDRVGAPGMVHAACWAHARRKFVDALKLNPRDVQAARMIGRMDEFFAVDAEARTKGMSVDGRHELRKEKSAPLLAVLKEELKSLSRGVLPASALGKAVSYTFSLWHKLTRFLEHPELELSNNIAENSMRGVALGRKNWIHVGSEKAGPKVAAIISVLESCRRLGVPVRQYLAQVLPELADANIQRLNQFTPLAWLDSKSPASLSTPGLL